jgi:hypothetical protein
MGHGFIEQNVEVSQISFSERDRTKKCLKHINLNGMQLMSHVLLSNNKTKSVMSNVRQFIDEASEFGGAHG